MLKRLPLLPTLMTLVALALLASLGQWQVERLNWKTALLETMEERVHGAPIRIVAQPADLPSWEYRRVVAEGVFDHSNEAHLQTTGPGGKAGYDIYTPLTQADGSVVIINRGFVPVQWKDRTTRGEGLPLGNVRVVGLARMSREAKWYMPKNNMVKNIWFTPNLAEMTAFMGVETPVPLFVDADETENAGGYPIGGQTILDVPNNHLDYALTWYGLALVLLVIYLLYLRRAFKETA